ncbi:hypothetical protein PoB_001649400 [Plakobranchus ocellatus]|uniref:Uncharacterized protein n=1 Tax=Plakobranchus ocellatus TaxID=259542 RepID=A0AAV3Z6J2_9GAST|nr:hypothetical protein PoB_001649400 [Plakobranchus ocellatus]
MVLVDRGKRNPLFMVNPLGQFNICNYCKLFAGVNGIEQYVFIRDMNQLSIYALNFIQLANSSFIGALRSCGPETDFIDACGQRCRAVAYTYRSGEIIDVPGNLKGVMLPQIWCSSHQSDGKNAEATNLHHSKTFLPMMHIRLFRLYEIDWQEIENLWPYKHTT